MQFILRPCQNCHKPMNGGVYRAPHICPHCSFEQEGVKAKATLRQKAPVTQQVHKEIPVAVTKTTDKAKTAIDVVLTTKPAHKQSAINTLDDVSAQCVLSLELTPSLFNDGKFIGAKSEKVQAALKQGKKNALSDLRKAARNLGANAVAGITVKNEMKKVDKTKAHVTVSVAGTAIRTALIDEPAA